MTAVDALARLKALHPDHFSDRNLRTTQRMVKAWRADQARRMIRCWTTALTIVAEDGMPPPPPVGPQGPPARRCAGLMTVAPQRAGPSYGLWGRLPDRPVR